MPQGHLFADRYLVEVALGRMAYTQMLIALDLFGAGSVFA